MLEIISTFAAVVSAVFQWLEYRYARKDHSQSAHFPQAVSQGVAKRKAATVGKILLLKQGLFVRWLIASTLISGIVLIALVLFGLNSLRYSFLFSGVWMVFLLIVAVLGACVSGVSIALGYVTYVILRHLRYYNFNDDELFNLKQDVDQKHGSSIIAKWLLQQALVEATKSYKN